MSSKERVRAIIAGDKAERCGLWLGDPHPDTIKIYNQRQGVDNFEEIRVRLGDDFRWLQIGDQCYKHPEGLPIWDFKPKSHDLSAEGWFANCESVAEIDDFAWPDVRYFDFTEVLKELETMRPYYIASGLWCPFFHLAAGMFGMENYFMKMFTHPDVVHAATARMVDFYIEASRRFFEAAGDLMDGFFFGNDFGSQLDLLVGPSQFKEFIFPYFKQLTDVGHEYDYQILLHSCGSIYKVIPDLIGLGVEAIHPIQAKAANMQAEKLGAEFGGKVAFIGGIDTQDLLVNGTPRQVRDDVKRVMAVLGPNLVVSPSHECILPNVPFENIEAMALAVVEGG